MGWISRRRPLETRVREPEKPTFQRTETSILTSLKHNGMVVYHVAAPL